MKVFNKDKAEHKLKLKQNKNKYIKYGTIGLSCLILIVAVLVFTFAYFESKTEFTIINGKVGGQLQDVNIIAIYQGEDKVDSIPAKGSGWDFDRADCTNGATASWNADSWSLILNFTTKTKCSIYFKVQEATKHYEILSGDISTVGSVVKIADEEFYVIGQEDSTHVKLLSKWNLKVGNIYDRFWNKTGEYTNADTGYGLQSSDVKGHVEGDSTFNGTVVFSSTNYWYDKTNNKAKDEYGGYTYNKSIYGYNDGQGNIVYPYVYDNNASISTYVNNYVTYLNNQGVSVSGRLIKQEELDVLGCKPSSTYRHCDSSNGGTAPSWVYQTTYWSGSADNDTCLWIVRSDGIFSIYNYYDSLGYGVRPVIILEK